MTQTRHPQFPPEDDFAVEELEQQHVAELPERNLLLGLSLLGIPLLNISGLDLKLS